MGKRDSRNKISVFNLNLRFGHADDGPNSWNFRKKIFGRLLSKYRSDFHAFQEANDFQAEYLRGILPGYGMIGERYPAPRYWQNNIIFYDETWKCVHRDHFFLSPTPRVPSRLPESRWPRQCTMGVFEKDCIQLVYLTTHFDFKPDVQAESARIVLRELSRLSGDQPVIISGDFNCGPSSVCHKVFTGEKSGRFKSVFMEPYPGTYHGFSGKPDGGYIDWMLFRGSIEPLESRVVRNEIDGLYPSDHFPLHAVFFIPGSAPVP